MPNIRINKVLRDLNVGLSSLVEFLNKKGHNVDENPNAKITVEQFKICLNEFGKDWSQAERDTLLNKYTSPRPTAQPQAAAQDSSASKKMSDDTKGTNMTKPVDAEVHPKREAQPAPARKDEPQSTQPSIGLKVVGHIDDDKKKTEIPAKVPVEKKAEPAPAEKAGEQPKPKAAATEKSAQKAVSQPADKTPQPTAAKTTKLPEEKTQPKETASTHAAQEKKEAEPIPSNHKDQQPKSTDKELHNRDKKSQDRHSGSDNEEKEPLTTASSANTKKKREPKPQNNIGKTTPKASKEDDRRGDKPDNSESTEPTGSNVFRIHDSQPNIGVTVVGKVDLSKIDSGSTRGGRRKSRTRTKHTAGKVDIKEASKNVGNDKRGGRRRAGAANNAQAGGRPQQGANNQQQQQDPNKGKGRKAQRNQRLKQQAQKAKPEVTQEQIQQQIKETLSKIQNRNRKTTAQAARYRRDKREAFRKEQEQRERLESEDRTVKLTEYVSANDLAQMIEVPVNDIISLCFNLGMMVSINQRLEKDTIDLILDEYGYTPEYVEAEVLDAIQEEEDTEEDLEPRAPIVTVMGHVDHGKTSLLDTIRNTNVISGEAGGITQHVGAYSVQLPNGRKITFLDTPGHEAFTAMRARGAKVTDIVIIVVAADDGVMPQTKEAINHASLANVPIIFAINKVDKPHANPDKIKEELAALNYLVEDWGGKYQSQNISAKKNIGIEELLDKVLLEADILELKANPNKRATGSVLESTMEVGRGYTTKVLIMEGTLHVGDHILAGTHYGRVKALFNERGQNVESVGPSDPVKVLGLNGAATAGEAFNVLETEAEVREIAGKRRQLQREQRERTQRIPTLQSLGQRIAEGKIKDLNVIVKGDVDGSVEALSDSIVKLSTDEIRVNVIHKAVGQISDSDVILASASDAVIIGFQVRPAASARKLADNEGVEIRTYSIIYTALDDLKDAIEGMLSPEIKERVTATLEVREIFRISKVGTIAGCIVKEGKISRNDKVRIIRDGIVIFTGELGSLKRFKDDVKEVGNGYECGLNVQNFNDILVGDEIEGYEEVEVRKKLQ